MKWVEIHRGVGAWIDAGAPFMVVREGIGKKIKKREGLERTIRDQRVKRKEREPLWVGRSTLKQGRNIVS